MNLCEVFTGVPLVDPVQRGLNGRCNGWQGRPNAGAPIHRGAAVAALMELLGGAVQLLEATIDSLHFKGYLLIDLSGCWHRCPYKSSIGSNTQHRC